MSRQSPGRTGNPKHVSVPPVRAAPLTSAWPWASCAIPFLSMVFPARLSTVSNFCGSLRSFLKYVHREDKISQDEQEHEELGRLK